MNVVLLITAKNVTSGPTLICNSDLWGYFVLIPPANLGLYHENYLNCFDWAVVTNDCIYSFLYYVDHL